MLPNWLYGKSKSKLASILGGGGIPEDYNQVKAQVNQNTENITLLSTSSQALTSAFTNNVNRNGCKNLLHVINKTTVNYANIIYTPNSDGSISVSNTTSSAIADYYLFAPDNKSANAIIPIENSLERDVDYILSTGRSSNGNVRLMLNLYDSNKEGLGVTFETQKNATFNLSTLDPNNRAVYYRIFLRVGEGATPVDNAVIYPMICLKSDYELDPTFVPYSMTNQELTKKLTSDANLATAVDLSAYNAYSSMYTAPSDGYVHFLSAASGSTARTIYTYGNNTTAATDPHFTHSTSANNKAFEIYIRKGLKVYVDGLSSGDTINFYPLT